jgi:hypothetical protein
MPKKPFLPENRKRTARITVLTTEDIKSVAEIQAQRDHRPLSNYCESLIIDGIERKK